MSYILNTFYNLQLIFEQIQIPTQNNFACLESEDTEKKVSFQPSFIFIRMYDELLNTKWHSWSTNLFQCSTALEKPFTVLLSYKKRRKNHPVLFADLLQKMKVFIHGPCPSSEEVVKNEGGTMQLKTHIAILVYNVMICGLDIFTWLSRKVHRLLIILEISTQIYKLGTRISNTQTSKIIQKNQQLLFHVFYIIHLTALSNESTALYVYAILFCCYVNRYTSSNEKITCRV